MNTKVVLDMMFALINIFVIDLNSKNQFKILFSCTLSNNFYYIAQILYNTSISYFIKLQLFVSKTIIEPKPMSANKISQYRSAIKRLLPLITNSIKQIPQDRQFIITNRVKKVLDKYGEKTKQAKQKNQPQDQNSLKHFMKQLEFNLNFIKLSYPNINFSEIQKQDNAQKGADSSLNINSDNLHKKSQHGSVNYDYIKGKQENNNQNYNQQTAQQQKNRLKDDNNLYEDIPVMNAQRISQERKDLLQQEFQLFNEQALRKQMKKISDVRQQVQFSNWSQGNVDPQNLTRHKQLLSRQHFAGEQWKGKEKPKMKTAQILAGFLANAQKSDITPPDITDENFTPTEKVFESDPSNSFEKVKR